MIFCIIGAAASTAPPKHSPQPPPNNHSAIYPHMASVSNEEGVEGGGKKIIGYNYIYFYFYFSTLAARIITQHPSSSPGAATATTTM